MMSTCGDIFLFGNHTLLLHIVRLNFEQTFIDDGEKKKKKFPHDTTVVMDGNSTYQVATIRSLQLEMCYVEIWLW